MPSDFEVLDEQPAPKPAASSSGFDVLGEEPVTPSYVTGKVASGQHVSEEEAKVVRDSEQQKGWFGKLTGFGPGDVWEGLKGTAGGVLKNSAKAWTDPYLHTSPIKQITTGAEGFARGTYDLADLIRRAGRKGIDLYRDLGASEEEQTRHLQERLNSNADWAKRRAEGWDKQGTLTPGLGAIPDYLKPLVGPNPAGAEASSVVLDPTLLIGGEGALGKGLLRGALAKLPGGARVLEAAGKAGEAASKVIPKTAGAVEKLAGTVAEKAAIPGEMLRRVPEELRPTAALAASTVTVPAYAVQRAAGATAKVAEFTRRLAELPGATQAGSRLQQLAKDAAAPAWVRNTARVLDARGVTSAALEAGSELAKGGAHGAALGTALGAVSGETGEERGHAVGGGIALGAGGRAGARYALPAGRAHALAQKQANDLSSLFSRLEDSGTRPDLLDRLPQHAADTLAAYTAGVDPSLKVTLHDANSFAAAAPDQPNAAAFYNPKTHEVALNLDRLGTATGHELGHALIASRKADGETRLMLDSTLGPGGIQKAAHEYASKLVDNDFQASKTPPPLDPAAREQLVQNKIAALTQAQGGDGWIYSEIIADAARKTINPDLYKDTLQPSLVRRVLDTLGVQARSDLASMLPPGALFSDTRIYGPDIAKMLQTHLREAHREGVKPIEAKETKEGAPAGIPVPVDMLGKHPSVPPTSDAVKIEGSQVVPRPPAEVKKIEKERQKAVAPIAEQPVKPKGDTTPEVAPRVGPDGSVEVRGTKISNQIGTMPQFNDEAKRIAKQVEALIDDKKGGVLRTWYQAVGSSKAGAWAKSVRQKLGNWSVSQVEIAPYDFHISDAGNVLVRGVSKTALDQKLGRWQQEGKLDQLWGGDADAFRADLHKYLQNHAQGLPGTTGLDPRARDALNLFVAGRVGKFKDANPLRAAAEGRDKNGIIRSVRLDRMANPESVPGSLPLDWNKQQRNFSPATAAGQKLAEEGFELNRTDDKGSPGISVIKNGSRVAEIRTRPDDSGNGAYVASVFVEKPFRGQGISEILYRELGKALQDAGIGELRGDLVSSAAAKARAKVFPETEFRDELGGQLSDTGAAEHLSSGGLMVEGRSKVSPEMEFAPGEDPLTSKYSTNIEDARKVFEEAPALQILRYDRATGDLVDHKGAVVSENDLNTLAPGMDPDRARGAVVTLTALQEWEAKQGGLFSKVAEPLKAPGEPVDNRRLMYAPSVNNLGFYSQLEETLKAIPPKSSPAQIRAMLRQGVKESGKLLAKPVKAEEMRDTKAPDGTTFEEWLNENPKATLDEIKSWAQVNKTKVYANEGAEKVEGEEYTSEPEPVRFRERDGTPIEPTQQEIKAERDNLKGDYTDDEGNVDEDALERAVDRSLSESQSYEWNDREHGYTIRGNRDAGYSVFDPNGDEIDSEISRFDRAVDAAQQHAYDTMSETERRDDEINTEPRYEQWTLGGDRGTNAGENYQEVVFEVPGRGLADSGHFSGNEDYVFHARTKEYKTPAGEKVFLIEETQSDLHREGREKGYQLSEPAAKAWLEKKNLAGAAVNEAGAKLKEVEAKVKELFEANAPAESFKATDELHKKLKAEYEQRVAEFQKILENKGGKLPDAPFKKSWSEFLLKWGLREAANRGAQYLAWVTGEQTQAHYDLRQEVKDLSWDGKTLRADLNNGRRREFPAASEEEIAKYVGKGVASRLAKAELPAPVKVMTESEWAAAYPEKWAEANITDPRPDTFYVVGPDGSRGSSRFTGREVAESYADRMSRTRTVSGEGLAMGGEWAVNMYDKAHVNFLEDYAKQQGWLKALGAEQSKPNPNQLELAGMPEPKAKRAVRDLEIVTEKPKASEVRYAVFDAQGNRANTSDYHLIGARHVAQEIGGTYKQISGGEVQPPVTETVHAIAIPDEVRNHLIEQGQPMYSPSGGETPDSLTALHNTTGAGLLAADRLGGIPAPSLAVMKREHSFSSYGDITLIAPRDVADPQQGAKAFDSDAYSPRQPRPEWNRIPAARSRAFQDKFREEIKRLDDYSSFHEVLESLGGSYRKPDKERAKQEMEKSAAVVTQFLKDVGGDPSTVYRRKTVPGMSSNEYSTALYKERETLRKIVADRQDEFNAWADNLLDPLFGDPVLKVGGKKVPYTAENVTAAMTGKTRAQENGMTFGPGAARAAASAPLRSIADMHAAEGSLVSDDAFSKYKETQEPILKDYREAALATKGEQDFRDTWDALDDSMKVLGTYLKGGKKDSPDRMAAALRRHGFGDDPETVNKAIAAAAALRDAPTEYFEAKPQRNVKLSEFAGAVVPEKTSPRVLAVLEKHGITVEKYKDSTERQAATERLRAKLAGEGKAVHFTPSAQDSTPVPAAKPEAPPRYDTPLPSSPKADDEEQRKQRAARIKAAAQARQKKAA